MFFKVILYFEHAKIIIFIDLTKDAPKKGIFASNIHRKKMQETPHLRMNDCPDDDKPREKMLQHGKKTLSNAELLAILLRSGSAEKNVMTLAQELMNNHGNSLTNMSLRTVPELMKTKGVGLAKATSIAAALELGRRLAGENQRPHNDRIKNSTDLYNVIAEKLSGQPTEEFWVVYLNTAHRMVGMQRISAGGITQTAVDIRLIYKGALDRNAIAVAVAHNHPSGNLKPSREDIVLTKKIAEAGKVLDIELVDHLIVGNGGLETRDYYSFCDEGML